MAPQFVLTEVHAATTDGWMLTGMADVERADKVLVYGHPDYARTVLDLESDLAHTEHEIQRWVVAVPADQSRTVVGLARLTFPLADNTHMAWSYLCVHPSWRRRGIGTMLLDWAEAASTHAGRTSWIHWLDLGLPAPGAPTVEAPEGGAIAADTPGWCFASRRGYVLEQVERLSSLAVPVDEALLARLEADAAAHTDGYRLHTWVDDIPERWRPSFAGMLGGFMTQVPTAGLDFESQSYDVARLEDDMRRIAEAGRSCLYAVAEHVASGQLVAATQLVTYSGDAQTVLQEMTLVLPEHRGHRLGMAIKVANLRQLARVRPDVRRVHTGNASENAHMLAINDALGFRPEGAEATLRKLL